MRSTGPKTETGKARVAGNAVQHGVLSTKLLLGHECTIEFQALFDDLVASLSPVGAMEHILVEKIASNLWRQRRLINAEKSTIEMRLRPEAITSDVSSALFGSFSARKLTSEDLEAPSNSHLDWCRIVQDEFSKISPGSNHSTEDLREIAPTIYSQLSEDAQDEGMTVEEYLDMLDGGLSEYVEDLGLHCNQEIEKHEKHPVIMQLAGWVHAKKSILKGELRDRLSRYQTTLDNELYKALRALREAQKWRTETIVEQAEPITEHGVP